jgi:hypothetical protein
MYPFYGILELLFIEKPFGYLFFFFFYVEYECRLNRAWKLSFCMAVILLSYAGEEDVTELKAIAV